MEFIESIIYGLSALAIGVLFLRLAYAGVEDNRFWQFSVGIFGTVLCFVLGVVIIIGTFLIYYS